MKAVMIFFEGLVFILFALWIAYFFVFAIFYRIPRRRIYPPSPGRARYLVIFPAYREDAVIVDSVSTFFKQRYPATSYEVVVVADSMAEETNTALRNLGATVLIPHYERRSKAAALNLAVGYAAEKDFDAAVILDADNLVALDFLERINDAFQAGNKAVQTHRIAKNDNTDMAYMDGISEEINNAIFRQGHVNAGLPAALAGSGMMFEMDWFARTIPKVRSMGEDKELELYLLEDRMHTVYLEGVYVWDEKVQNKRDFSNQRKRWIAAQLDTFSATAWRLRRIISTRNWPMLDKLVQWSIPPRIIILGVVPLWALFLSVAAPAYAIKWFFLYLLFILALFLAVPNRFFTVRTVLAFLKLPLIFLAILRSIAGIKGARNTFVHTPHGEKKEDHTH